MDKVLLKRLRSEVQYQGRFENLIFSLLANPAALYQSILRHLGKYGATLQGLTSIGSPLADANVGCLLTALSIATQVRLDRLDINFLRFHEVGAETAKQVLLDTWAAIHEVDTSIQVVEHTVSLTVYTQIQGTSYDQIIGRYVMIPADFGDNTYAGVAFYLPEKLASGERSSVIVLDRLAGHDQGLLLKVTAVFDAQRVPFATLAQVTDAYLIGNLDRLGLAVEREDGQ